MIRFSITFYHILCSYMFVLRISLFQLLPLFFQSQIFLVQGELLLGLSFPRFPLLDAFHHFLDGFRFLRFHHRLSQVLLR